MKFTNKVLVVALVAMVTFAVGATPTTNDLGTVLLRMQTATSPKNPFVDDLGDGTWSFKMTDGNLLPEDFTIATRPGFYGCGLSTYPMVMVNTTGASAGWGAESPYAANEVRVHPGNDAALGVRIEFKASRPGIYRIEGSVRATDSGTSDGVLFQEIHGFLTASVVTTKDLATYVFGSGEIALREGEYCAFEMSRRASYACDSTGLMLRIIRLRDFRDISKSINEAIAANPSGYGDTVETDWMNVTFGKTTSVGGEMTTLEHATDGTAFVGWRNVSGGKVPDIFANVSGEYAVFASDILPMSPSELFVRPGRGVYDMIRFVSRVAGNYMMKLNIRDCDPGGEGTVAAVLVNGALYKELNVDNNGNVFIPVYLEPLKVGDTVDFVYRSQKDGGQSTAGDSSALGIVMCEEEDLGDTKVLQALLDAGGAVVFPEGEYTIVKPLVIRSGTTLTCEEGVHIQMSDARALPLLVNEHFDAGADGDISVIGGLWDGRNIHRDGRQADPLILLAGVTNLTVRGLTVMNPVAGGIQLADVEDFLVEDVLFDCNGVTEGENGVVVNGFANRGMIRNLSGGRARALS